MARSTAKQIAKDAGLEFEHVLYRQTGDWYHILDRFPAALLDDGGYIPFHTEEDYRSFIDDNEKKHVREYKNKNMLHVKNGISESPRYLRFQEQPYFPEEVVQTELLEGTTVRITVNRYERNARAKRLCLAKWGTVCVVCNFSFAHVYGRVGEGFINVHHLVPIASIKKKYKLVPERDLRPVCPNCHAMLHRQEPPYSIEELCALIKASI